MEERQLKSMQNAFLSVPKPALSVVNTKSKLALLPTSKISTKSSQESYGATEYIFLTILGQQMKSSTSILFFFPKNINIEKLHTEGIRKAFYASSTPNEPKWLSLSSRLLLTVTLMQIDLNKI